MSAEPHKNIRQVQLPSGKIIEVLYFAGHEGEAAPVAPVAPGVPATRHSTHTELHICPQCGGDLVYPVDWSEAGPAHWEVQLRCPECEWHHVGVFSQDTVERFDLELDRGAEVLLRDLQQLSRANMAEDVERFIVALRDDHIQPLDF